MNAQEWLMRLQGSRAAILGFGISNRPLAEVLLTYGATVTVRDKTPKEALGEFVPRLEARGVRFLCGADYLEDLDEEILFRAPGIRPDVPQISRAVARGAILTSEMELFLDLTPATVIGITGSDGKTTTTTLAGKMLERACEMRGRGRVYVGGNIGTPLLPLVDQMTADDFAVVELSSFQLQTVRNSPVRAAITNLSKNHLDWHTGMEEYIAAKTNIYRHPQNRVLITNGENNDTRELGMHSQSPVIWFSSSKNAPADFDGLCKVGDQALYLRDGWITHWDGEGEHRILEAERILLPGTHNLENYMTSIGLTLPWITPEIADGIATTFRGVQHRLELVATVSGVKYYNSSIDSSPSRTAAALSALRERPIVICGGYDKHIPFAPLAEALCRRAKCVVLTGATAEKIAEALKDCLLFDPDVLPVIMEKDFQRAVLQASRMAKRGDTVLLSPACASFDAFKNFEERGKVFCAIVEEISRASDHND